MLGTTQKTETIIWLTIVFDSIIENEVGPVEMIWKSRAHMRAIDFECEQKIGAVEIFIN